MELPQALAESAMGVAMTIPFPMCLSASNIRLRVLLYLSMWEPNVEAHLFREQHAKTLAVAMTLIHWMEYDAITHWQGQLNSPPRGHQLLHHPRLHMIVHSMVCIWFSLILLHWTSHFQGVPHSSIHHENHVQYWNWNLGLIEITSQYLLLDLSYNRWSSRSVFAVVF